MREHGGLALGIAGVAFVFFAFLPFVLALLVFVFLMVTMVVKAIGSGAPPSEATILIGIVLIVGALATAFGGVAGLVGRSMTPRRRDRVAP